MKRLPEIQKRKGFQSSIVFSILFNSIPWIDIIRFCGCLYNILTSVVCNRLTSVVCYISNTHLIFSAPLQNIAAAGRLVTIVSTVPNNAAIPNTVNCILVIIVRTCYYSLISTKCHNVWDLIDSYHKYK